MRRCVQVRRDWLVALAELRDASVAYRDDVCATELTALKIAGLEFGAAHEAYDADRIKTRMRKRLWARAHRSGL